MADKATTTTKTEYTAKTLLRHSKTGKLVKAGERIDLSHLNATQIARLKGQGAIS